MARPSKTERKAIEERREKYRLEREAAAERERASHQQIARLVEASQQAPKPALPDVAELVRRLEEIRAIAMSAIPPQTGPAVQCIVAEAKILGLMLDRQAVMTGTPQQFGIRPDEDEQQFRELGERHGPEIEKEFRKFVAKARKIDEERKAPKLIDARAEDIAIEGYGKPAKRRD
jgi:hypothetical protein